jgi:photosystem II stability/assembly factor-like uncharacterized protein
MFRVKISFTVVFLFISAFVYSQSGWFCTTDSVSNLYLTSICFPDANTGYAAGSYNTYNPSGAIYKTTNSGLNWQISQVTANDVKYIYFIDASTGFYLGGTPGSSVIYKTTNGGINWISKYNYVSGDQPIIVFYNSNTGIVTAGHSLINKTTNGGENWYLLPNAPWLNLSTFIMINQDVWIVASPNYFYKTTNGGVTWRMLDFTGIGMQTWTMYFINSTTGYSSSMSGMIFKTTNTGENWTYISTINNSFITGGNLFFTNELTGYLGSYETGVSMRKTTNGGYNWVPQTVNSHTNFKQTLFINSSTGFAVSINYSRIYKTTNGGATFIANISAEVPEKFSLSQNYPNPFNQSSIINLQCSMKGMVTLKVFDISGREVQTLVNETLSPGTYQVRFDGSGLSSGIYYYKLTVDSKPIAVKKMVMIK